MRLDATTPRFNNEIESALDAVWIVSIVEGMLSFGSALARGDDLSKEASKSGVAIAVEHVRSKVGALSQFVVAEGALMKLAVTSIEAFSELRWGVDQYSVEEALNSLKTLDKSRPVADLRKQIDHSASHADSAILRSVSKLARLWQILEDLRFVVRLWHKSGCDFGLTWRVFDRAIELSKEFGTGVEELFELWYRLPDSLTAPLACGFVEAFESCDFVRKVISGVLRAAEKGIFCEGVRSMSKLSPEDFQLPKRLLKGMVDRSEFQLTPELEEMSKEADEGTLRAQIQADSLTAGATGLKRLGILFDFLFTYQDFLLGSAQAEGAEEDLRKAHREVGYFCDHLVPLLYESGFEAGGLIAEVEQISSDAFAFADRSSFGPKGGAFNVWAAILRLKTSHAIGRLREEIDNDAISADKGSSAAMIESMADVVAVKRRTTVEEAEPLVRGCLLKNRSKRKSVGIRDIVSATGVSKGTVGKTNAWKAYMGMRRDKSARVGRSSVRARTKFNEAAHSPTEKGDNVLNSLIASQEHDYEPSPLDPQRAKVRSHS